MKKLLVPLLLAAAIFACFADNQKEQTIPVESQDLPNPDFDGLSLKSQGLSQPSSEEDQNNNEALPSQNQDQKNDDKDRPESSSKEDQENDQVPAEIRKRRSIRCGTRWYRHYYRCCGNRHAYNPHTNMRIRCCGNRIYSLRFSSCCGNKFLYSPRNFKCCGGRFVRYWRRSCKIIVRYVGCFREKTPRALPRLLAVFPRSVARHKCALLAYTRGYKLFALQNGGACFSGSHAYTTYYRYGKLKARRNCRGGVGGPWVNAVYFFHARRPKCGRDFYYPHKKKCCRNRKVLPFNKPCVKKKYEFVGCFRDAPPRALPKFLHYIGGFPKKRDAVRLCASVAWQRGYKLFALQNGGACFSGPNADTTYFRHGKSSNCRDYVGGPWANDVYFFNERKPRCRRRIYIPHKQKCCCNKYLKPTWGPC